MHNKYSTMHFCPKCENMMYFKLIQGEDDVIQDSELSLRYHCPNCDTMKESDDATQNGHLVFFKSYEDEQDETAGMNEYVQYDPTLPTTAAVPCPNEKCVSNTDGDDKQPRDIVYIRHNTVRLKYTYMCRHCSTTWKSAGFV